MLDELGLFDGPFFLYCEDTDLGLRARWAGWKCLYVPEAVVEHHYSHSAGRASPGQSLLRGAQPAVRAGQEFSGAHAAGRAFCRCARYLWHVWYMLAGRGSAARFRAEGHAGPRMIWYVLRAHAALLAMLGRLLRQRREIRARARITPAVFRHLVRCHSIGSRKVAAL